VGLDRKRLLAYAAIAIVVLAVGVRYLLAQKGGGSGSQGVVLTQASTTALSATPQTGGGSPGASAAASAQPSAAPDLVVDICGEVARPGVYHLAAGARICDLLEAAGGATGRAELAAVNLAAKLTDGQQVVVPKRGQAVSTAPSAGVSGGSGGASVPGAAAGPVNLNLATVEQLDALPGVGPSTAQKIVDYRTSNGGFRSVEDLKNVSGIGDAKFAALKDLVTV
jgi:competence protein ComEA